MRAKVAETGRREQGVTSRVRGHIPVGMPRQAGLARPQQPGKVQRAPVGKRMDVNPNPNTRQDLHSRQPTDWAANARAQATFRATMPTYRGFRGGVPR